MFNDFKPVLKILLRFIIIYLMLLMAYQFYLKPFEGIALDDFSRWVARQVQWTQNQLGYETQLYHEAEKETEWYYVVDRYVTRMVEGCNAVSVMILFMAFVLAFYKGFKTIVFVVGGLVLLHLMNVLRIVGLNIVMYDYPQYGKMAHDYAFPAVIYGTVVVLWLVWIQFFVLKKER